VPIEPFANVNADAYFYTEPGGFASGALTGRPIRHRTARADLYGYTSELLAKVANQGALDQEVSETDRDALVEYLRVMGALGPEDRYLGSGRRGFTSPPGAGDQPVLLDQPFDLSDLLAAGFGYFFPFELEWDQAMMMFQPIGGMDRIPYALADQIRGEIRYGCEVQSIRSADDAVEVVYTRSGSNETGVRADYAVCAIPPPILTRITNDFSDDVIRDLVSISMMTTAKMGLEYKRRFWEEDDHIFGGITNTNLDISTIWYPSSGCLTDRGILIGYYNYMGDAAAYDALSPSARAARAIEQGRKIHGDAYQNEFVSSFSAQWSRIKYSEGGWGYVLDAIGGALRRLGEAQGRVYFAGDHISQVSSWQHGAFESARQAVNKLHQRVLHGSIPT
jgi:monoamine oxidase